MSTVVRNHYLNQSETTIVRARPHRPNARYVAGNPHSTLFFTVIFLTNLKSKINENLDETVDICPPQVYKSF